MSLTHWISGRVFNLVHGRNLVYNTCWEDPRLDRVALALSPHDNVLVITSAGCNALDYALTGPKHVYAVDMNPRQNALLDLKIAGIKGLDYETFFAMFGRGRVANVRGLYRDKLRSTLPPASRKYWDRFHRFFDDGRRCPFYFRGTSGTFARMVNVYIDRVVKLRPWINAIFAAKTLQEQQEIFDNHLRDRFWTKPLKFAMKRDSTMSMLGVPRSQREHLERDYDGGILAFVNDCLEHVFARLPIQDNYFWRVYCTGGYTQDCCPEYLKPENFQRLKDGLADRVSTHTDSVQGFLDNHEGEISRFVLLDHMDWLCDKLYPALEAEWQAIVRRAAPAARVIWRSGGVHTDFVDRVEVDVDGKLRRVGELLTYHRDLAADLHEKDRVHTYGSFHIADLAA
jgi:S-adenosylmethionine-diacylglycerol 3-amino-3-carboxypropyl transferase